MFLCVLMMLLHLSANCSQRNASIVISNEPVFTAGHTSSEDELSDEVIKTFMRRTDINVAPYIKHHLSSAIKEATSSPESDDEDSPSPKRIIRTWVRQPESISTTPRPELDNIILAAVQKAFEEKEAILERKEKKIESMFSKKSTALITTATAVLVTITSSLGSAYGVKNHFDNCTK